MTTEAIIAALDNLRDVNNQSQMSAMLSAVDALNEEPQPAASEAMFRVLERFPEHDGYETFWSILHLLEDTPHYEPELVRSLERQPNEFNVLMISRLLNAGIHNIGEFELLPLLRQALANERTPLEVKVLAGELIAKYTS